MAEQDKESSTPKFSFTIRRLNESSSRLARLSDQNRIRDVEEIWEAYCDVEEAIAISNFKLGVFDRVGKTRKLTISFKDDPSKMPEQDLRKRFISIESNLSAAKENFEKGMGDEGAELARRARDDLKKMLIGHEKSNKSAKNVRTSYSR
ncbi:MAG: hypothetical protein OK439_04795 [Thaumarchaeota archaeon]|nr:hypothetical protein [Nitrososphaerota archaeon]